MMVEDGLQPDLQRAELSAAGIRILHHVSGASADDAGDGFNIFPRDNNNSPRVRLKRQDGR